MPALVACADDLFLAAWSPGAPDTQEDAAVRDGAAPGPPSPGELTDAGEPTDVGEAADLGERPPADAAGATDSEAGDVLPVSLDAAATEVCNGRDDDHNGLVDDGDFGAPCSTGRHGLCAAGVTACRYGELLCIPDVEPNEELCDGLDNDCDGAADDDVLGRGVACVTEAAGRCEQGRVECVAGAWGCIGLHSPEAESCNGVDDDCDGETDEGVEDCGPCTRTGRPTGWSCLDPTGLEGFAMGSPPEEPGRQGESLHRVVLTRSFLLLGTELTQEGWRQVAEPAGLQVTAGFVGCPDCPMEQVSWFDAVAWCNARSRQEGLEECYVIEGEAVVWPNGLDCEGYRLPTEAEWEYAARARSPGGLQSLPTKREGGAGTGPPGHRWPARLHGILFVVTPSSHSVAAQSA